MRTPYSLEMLLLSLWNKVEGKDKKD